ncbi:ferrous iron transport protein B [Gorillibacterium massiliense]|uniref:ferrous iron transport protein B n=1 Tax=Gorillibacterium massiliense TaxID=1280390 RepID=UPI0004B04AD3|nr:ferrous iron transport protein B [Gorillibacterium massiliense]
MLNVALAGNPNTGKSSLFNILTGSYEYVGNWTGVTIEKKVGLLKNKKGYLIDLPGIYSVNPLSRDEGVTARFLLTEEFSLIMNVVDASQLERNLNLTLQLLEFGRPMVISLNMVDVARQRGMEIDTEKLSAMLHTPVIPVVARSGKGIDALLDAVMSVQSAEAAPLHINYGYPLENSIDLLVHKLPAKVTHNKRWLAVQFFEGNEVVRDYLEQHVDPQYLKDLYQKTEAAVVKKGQTNLLSLLIRQKRSAYIQDVLAKCVTTDSKAGMSFSDKIDRIVTHRVFGVVIFLAFMYLTFKLTFEWVGGPISDLLDSFFSGPLTNWFTALLDAGNASKFMYDLVLDGIISGVGGVLVFVPQIFILFLIISFIEDSGYMARIATVMDKVMEKMGLNGKAIIPMIIGFGCNVPGVMAARSIEQPKERLLTTLLNPLMSCSARLPVYSLFVGAFFVRSQAIVVLSLYVLGVVVALIVAKIFSITILKKEQSFFLVELPPYRVPQWQSLSRSTWEKGKGFIRKAGTFIFGGSVLIWLLSYAGPKGFDVPMDESFLAMIGGLFKYILAPIGFGTWQAGASLVTGFLAKEVVVSSMSIIYAAPESGLTGLLSQYFTPLQAYSFMAFVLLYVPCLATVGAIRKETMSAKWTWFAVCYSLVVAYIIAIVIYQGGKLLGLG